MITIMITLASNGGVLGELRMFLPQGCATCSPASRQVSLLRSDSPRWTGFGDRHVGRHE